MARDINVKVRESLTISNGMVKRIFETSARRFGNGAIIYVPKEYLENKFYVIVVKKEEKKVTNREINVNVEQNLQIIDGEVKMIFETSAKKCGNGAIIYVPKEHLENKFYVIVTKKSAVA
jgi:putative transposon-encoded protein